MSRFRRLLDRLGTPAKPRPGPGPPQASPPPGPGGLDGAALSRLGPLLVWDLRPQAVLAHGIVEGSVLCGEHEVPDLAPGRDRDLAQVLLTDTDDPEALLARLREHLPLEGYAWPGPAALEAAGCTVKEPGWKSPMPVRHPVRATPAVLARHGVSSAHALDGTVQDVAWPDEEFVYTVLFVDGQRWLRVTGLVEEELISVGPRGAAGMGETM